MIRKGKEKTASVCLAAAVILTCCLIQTIDCYRLKKTERREGRKEADATKDTAVQGGRIVFGRNFETGAGLDPWVIDGSKKSSSNASTEDDAAYQADSAGWSRGHMQDASGKEALWKRMAPSLQCGGDQLKFRAMGPGASHFTVERGNGPPMPLSHVPPTCGYNMQKNPFALVMSVPYDGCNMVQEGGNYVLPMRWQGIPVSLWCPKSAAPAPQTPLHPPYHQMPQMPVYPQYGMHPDPAHHKAPPPYQYPPYHQYPQYPQVPQMPQYPQAPQVPHQYPQVPYQYPQAPQVPHQYPQVPHQYPQVPQVPHQYPQVPHQYPQVPQVPHQYPQVPQVPHQYPQVPKFPSMPDHSKGVTTTPAKSQQPPMYPFPFYPMYYPPIQWPKATATPTTTSTPTTTQSSTTTTTTATPTTTQSTTTQAATTQSTTTKSTTTKGAATPQPPQFPFVPIYPPFYPPFVPYPQYPTQKPPTTTPTTTTTTTKAPTANPPMVPPPFPYPPPFPQPYPQPFPPPFPPSFPF